MKKRVIPAFERKQRGCQYCLHVTTMRYEGQFRNACPFAECPYKVLDKYKSYEEFMASEDSKILVTEFFKTFPDCYEMARCENTPQGIFKDKGDYRMRL